MWMEDAKSLSNVPPTPPERWPALWCPPCDCPDTAGCHTHPQRGPTRQVLCVASPEEPGSGSFAQSEKLVSPTVDSDPNVCREEGLFDKNVSKYFGNTSLHFFLELP